VDALTGKMVAQALPLNKKPFILLLSTARLLLPVS
jgi:hypothetical protein